MKNLKVLYLFVALTTMTTITTIILVLIREDKNRFVALEDECNNPKCTDSLIYVDTAINNTKVTIKYCNDMYIDVNVCMNEIVYSKKIDKLQLPSGVDISSAEVKIPSMFITTNNSVELFSKVAFVNEDLLIIPIFNKDYLFNVLILKVDSTNGVMSWLENEHWLPKIDSDGDDFFFSLIIDVDKMIFAVTDFYEHMPSEDKYSLYKIDQDRLFYLGDKFADNANCKPKLINDDKDFQKMILCIKKSIM